MLTRRKVLNIPKLLTSIATTLFFFTISLQCTTVKFPNITEREDLNSKTVKAHMCTPVKPSLLYHSIYKQGSIRTTCTYHSSGPFLGYLYTLCITSLVFFVSKCLANHINWSADSSTILTATIFNYEEHPPTFTSLHSDNQFGSHINGQTKIKHIVSIVNFTPGNIISDTIIYILRALPGIWILLLIKQDTAQNEQHELYYQMDGCSTAHNW